MTLEIDLWKVVMSALSLYATLAYPINGLVLRQLAIMSGIRRREPRLPDLKHYDASPQSPKSESSLASSPMEFPAAYGVASGYGVRRWAEESGESLLQGMAPALGKAVVGGVVIASPAVLPVTATILGVCYAFRGLHFIGKTVLES